MKHEIKFKISEIELREIEDWLRNEILKSKDGKGFLNNWNLIFQAFIENKISIIKIQNAVVGFCIWTENEISVEIDIFEIHPDYRKQGLGKIFYDEISKWFQQNGYVVIKLFCEPKSSEKFWKKMKIQKVSKYWLFNFRTYILQTINRTQRANQT